MSDTTSGPGPAAEGDAPVAAAPGTAVTQGAGAPVGADMMQAVTMIDRGVKERRDTDTILMNYWLYFFLVSWVTFGIYTIVLFFKRINRIDGFSGRKALYYESVIDWTERYAKAQGKEDAVHHMLGDMRSEVQSAYKGDMRKIGAGISFLLAVVTLGLYGLYVLYRMNRYWWDAQVLEQDFDDKLSQAWTTLELMRYPVSFTVDQGKRRSYALYLILSIVTLGIWGIVWDYKIQTDPENLFKEFHSIEDTVLQTVRAS
jgi:Domain of unknown function (DUF4234)